MLVGQQLGPFILDKELGSGAMGTVYRGRYLKTGQVVAVKVMAPGLGATNRTAVERFEREAAILKQLKHPHIVSLFGIGKSHGTRYIAMEFIDGESLDKVMARRSRMSWEEVAEIGQQLCGALQHAHDKGIIHRDLKPSNLMVLADGTLKLTDFGIAKDLDLDALTSANCTIGTAAYMSPEQCKGERILTNKSDLYSLGVVFYELITGRKPFNAENAMDMFLQHVQGEFPRPAHLVMELPVWLDNLICGMLAKKPDDRPIDSQMVANILGSIRQKVEEQKSAGVEVANARRKDLPADKVKLTAEDKNAARFLLKGKVRRQKRPNIRKPVWKKALALSLMLVVSVLALVLVFLPKSARVLYEEAIKMIEDHEKVRNGPLKEYLDRYEKAREGPVEEYLRRFGSTLAKHDNTKHLQDFADEYDVAWGEYLLNRHLDSTRVQSQPGDEEKAFGAIDKESPRDLKNVDLKIAKERWEGLHAVAGRRWRMVAERHLKVLQDVENLETKFTDKRDLMQKSYKDQSFEDEEEQKAFLAWRADLFGDRAQAYERWTALKDTSEGAGEKKRDLYLLALSKVGKGPPPGVPEVIARERKTNVEKMLNEARADKNKDPHKAYVTCRDILKLYGDTKDKELQELVEGAGGLKKDIDDNQK